MISFSMIVFSIFMHCKMFLSVGSVVFCDQHIPKHRQVLSKPHGKFVLAVVDDWQRFHSGCLFLSGKKAFEKQQRSSAPDQTFGNLSQDLTSSTQFVSFSCFFSEKMETHEFFINFIRAHLGLKTVGTDRNQPSELWQHS